MSARLEIGTYNRPCHGLDRSWDEVYGANGQSYGLHRQDLYLDERISYFTETPQGWLPLFYQTMSGPTVVIKGAQQDKGFSVILNPSIETREEKAGRYTIVSFVPTYEKRIRFRPGQRLKLVSERIGAGGKLQSSSRILTAQ